MAMRFDILSYVLIEPFSISTLIGDSIVANGFYRSFPLSLSHRVTHVDVLELDMLYYDVTLRMDLVLFSSCFYWL